MFKLVHTSGFERGFYFFHSALAKSQTAGIGACLLERRPWPRTRACCAGTAPLEGRLSEASLTEGPAGRESSAASTLQDVLILGPVRGYQCFYFVS